MPPCPHPSTSTSSSSPSRRRCPARCQSPHTHVFGWRYQDWGDDYSDTQARDSDIGTGISSQPGTCPQPLAVIYTELLEAARQNVLAAGGEITREIFSFPGGRRFHFRDPAGNELAVWSDVLG